MRCINSHLLIHIVCILIGFTFTAQAQVRVKSSLGCFCNPVNISTQPVSPAPTCPAGGASVFTVQVNGTGPFTFQWQENFVNLSDQGSYSGSQTASLTITNPSISLNGKKYRCVISNCGGKKVVYTDNTAMLTVTTLSTDINKDGIVNMGDFSLLLQTYNLGCPNCPEDINQDGMVNILDFLLLISQFNSICM